MFSGLSKPDTEEETQEAGQSKEACQLSATEATDDPVEPQQQIETKQDEQLSPQHCKVSLLTFSPDL